MARRTRSVPIPQSEDGLPMKLPLSDISTDFLMCRRGHLGHHWSWTDDYEIVTGPRGRPIEAKRVFTCERCGTVKAQSFRLPSMEPLNARMDYPHGYLSVQKVTALEVRREHFQRAFVG